MKAVLRDLNGALALLTTLPTPDHYPDNPGRAYAYFPLVGMIIGVLLAVVQAVMNRFTAPDVTAFGVLLAWVLLTGGLHLDGFGDSCDGLFAAAAPERRLKIMKDPRTGSWAVIGLVLLLLGKWLGLRGAPPAVLIAAAATGRMVMVVAAVSFRYARGDGMGGYYRRGLGRGQLVTAALLYALVLALARASLLPLVVAWGAALIAARWAAGRLGGGLTGDVYGALGELAELLVLLAALNPL